MTIDVIRKNLGDWQNEPVVHDEKQIGGHYVAPRNLSTAPSPQGLCEQGFGPSPRQGNPAPQDAATMLCYLYAFAEAHSS